MRKTNIELLRLLSMFLIVLSHYCVHTIWPSDLSRPLRCLVNMGSLGEVGVCIFLLITGYFSYKTSIKFRNLLRTILQISFYSLLGFILAVMLKLDADYEYFSLTPVISGTYWFATVYVALYLTIPLLNQIVAALPRKGHRNILFVGYFVLCVIPFIFRAIFIFSNFVFCCYVYLIGSYLGKYSIVISSQKISACLCAAWTLLPGTLALTTLFPVTGIYQLTSQYFYSLNSILVLPAALSLFMAFTQLRIPQNYLINKLATGTFGVYLLSDNFLLSPSIWKEVQTFAPFSVLPASLFVICSLLAVASVYAVSLCVDLLRKAVIEKPVFSLLDPLVNRVSIRINRLLNYSD